MTRKRKLCEMNSAESSGTSNYDSLHAALVHSGITFNDSVAQKENEEAVDDPSAQPGNQNVNLTVMQNAQPHYPVVQNQPALPQEQTAPHKKKKQTTLKEHMKKIVMKCEWNMCHSVFYKMEPFVTHVAEHCTCTKDHLTGDGYICYWRECGFACPTTEELDRHIFFHAFHTKIKSLGTVVLKEKNYHCSLDSSGCNMIPEIPEPFQCMWEDCKVSFASAQNFYWHVQSHVVCSDPNTDKVYKCFWEGCSTVFTQKIKLRDHMRSHTQEKLVGCPNCGMIYSCNTKLYDHCSQQIPFDMLHYKCSHCSRKFGTERLLRDHLRHHINLFKCSECDMTTPSKSTLATHFRFRHSKEKPHKCPQCGRGFKHTYDLGRHMTTHSDEPAYVCPYEECDFAAKAVTTLMRHVKRKHNGMMDKPYLCHICNTKYDVGYRLSKHLMQVHNFHCPSGHSRFRYIQDEDGYYRLQTVRYESIELTQVMANELGEENQNGQAADSPQVVNSPATTVSACEGENSTSGEHGGVPLTPRSFNEVQENSKELQKRINLKPPSIDKQMANEDIILPLEYAGLS